jgi:carboxyl-terminal processing protease
MYKNSKHTVLFPLLLAAGVVLGLVLGQYLGRNTTTSQLKGMLSRMALPNNKLSYTLSLIENQYVDSPSTLSRCWSRSWTPIRSISPPRKCRL